MNLKQLKEQFPYMFVDNELGFRVARGWIGIFEELCSEIDTLGAADHGFCWVQLKEKFGTARFYWDLSGMRGDLRVDVVDAAGGTLIQGTFERKRKSSLAARELREKIEDLVQAAEGRTQSACISCGADATPDRSGGYVLVLCDQHQKLRRSGGSVPMWFNEHDE